MIFGIPKGTHRHEYRVGLTPYGAAQLVRRGHTVFVEKGAGHTAHFTDERYEKAGAQIVHSAEEAYLRADIVCRVDALTPDEFEFVKPGHVICGFHHLAVQPHKTVERLMELETTLVGYEIIEDEDGRLPIVIPMSEIGGQMAVNIASSLLLNRTDGRGILLGSVPGVPPPTVLILGAGNAGTAAARQALACSAHVIVFDHQFDNLHRLNTELRGRIVTVMGGPGRLKRFTEIADLVIGAILVPGGRTPHIVTEEMVKKMKAGSVIIDLSIDQGGCVETSRPTTLADPTFVRHDVVHYCVPTMTSNIARTASRALANVTVPFLFDLADKPLARACAENDALARGVYLYQGRMVNERAGETLGITTTPLRQLLEEGE